MKVGKSPSGKVYVPHEGPMDAKIMLLGESPARDEVREGRPFVGRAGKVLNQCLIASGIRRQEVMVANCVPCRAPGDKFSAHVSADVDWGMGLLEDLINKMPQLQVIVAMGGNPMNWLTGHRKILKWRGSVIPGKDIKEADGSAQDPRDPNRYWHLLSGNAYLGHVVNDKYVIGSLHPAAVARQFVWHVWLINDLKKAKALNDHLDAGKCGLPRKRAWFYQNPTEFHRVVHDVILPHEHMVSVDTEMDPKIVCIVTEAEVHTFEWHEKFREDMEVLMSSRNVLKVAHNMNHDWRWLESVLGIRVSRPWFDTMAGAHYLEPSGSDGDRDRKKSAGQQQVGKALSPHISSKYTNWPYHKWLVDIDPLTYCGIDTVVAYDAYWEQLDQMSKRPELMPIANMDAKLFEVFMDMTRRGVLVDEVERQRVEQELRDELWLLDGDVVMRAQMGIARGLGRGPQGKRVRGFLKPHLFEEEKQCPCCGGGKKKVEACWSCLEFDKAPGKVELIQWLDDHEKEYPEKALKKDLEAIALPTCRRCKGTGTMTVAHSFNPGSSDALADLLYRGWGIPPRRQKGSETTAYELLARLVEPGGYLHEPQDDRQKEARAFLDVYLLRNRVATDLATIERITPGSDGRLRCVFDMWYTPTLRVASRESLLDQGTNLQNIPKPARRFIIPDEGYAFAQPDYAQIEGRCVAVVSDDKALRDIYSSGGDSHMEVVKLLASMGVEIDRQAAKRLAFASMYGIEEDHLASILGVSHLQARKILQAFFSVFRGVRRYHEDVRRQLKESRSVKSPTGWTRRWLGYIMHTRGRKAGMVRDKVWKEGLATPPQNMGAHVMGLGLLNLWENTPWILPLLQVHDAAGLLIPMNRLAEGIQEMEKQMTVTVWDMPFPVDASVGPNWYVASMSDEEKIKQGYEEWTRKAVLDAAG